MSGNNPYSDLVPPYDAGTSYHYSPSQKQRLNELDEFVEKNIQLKCQ